MRAAYAALAYLVFLGSLVYFVAFVEGVVVAPSVDAPVRAHAGAALGIDVAWLVLFGLQHSVMARASFKRAWTRLIPPRAERSTYVLASSLMLVVLFVVWQPIPTVLWQAPAGAASYALHAVSVAGWCLALAATFAIDHFDLFGVRGLFGASDASGASDVPQPTLQTPLLYRWVRHPLYLGFLVAFWATPHMTVGHAILALGLTLYILIGVHFEERDLVRTFGESYLRYRDEVPALLPWPRPRAHS